jgi:hypothetical protein
MLPLAVGKNITHWGMKVVNDVPNFSSMERMCGSNGTFRLWRTQINRR